MRRACSRRPPAVEPLMGYTSSSDPFAQVRLKFATREDAIAYAEKHGIAQFVVDYRQIITAVSRTPQTVALPADVDMDALARRQTLLPADCDPARLRRFLHSRVVAEAAPDVRATLEGVAHDGRVGAVDTERAAALEARVADGGRRARQRVPRRRLPPRVAPAHIVLLPIVLALLAQGGVAWAAFVAVAAALAAFLMMEEDRAGALVEYGLTSELFTNPKDKRTEDYITGRFG